MTDLLRIGASGVFAYRDALAIVGDNVANSETDGYARRSVTMTETSSAHAVNPYYLGRASPGGVELASVNRAWDDFKASESRIGSSDSNRADARMRWLINAETALDDSNTGAGAKITAFFNAADALAADPAGELPRRNLLFTLTDAASAIRTTAASLQRASDGIATETRLALSEVNRDVASLADINISLNNSTIGTPVHASLLDERDRLVDNIASKIGVDVAVGPKGAVSLSVAGSTSTVLVSGNRAATIDLVIAGDGRISLSHNFDGVLSTLSPVGGSLSGLVDASQVVAGRRQTFDGIAADFATTLNTWSAGGVDANGNPGGAMLSIGAAGATSLTVVMSDPDLIAAGTPGGAANGNLLALQNLRTNGVEVRLANLVSIHAEAVSGAKTEATATAARADALFALRDTVSGVDLDREATDLLRYQQAYNASSRIIQVARETIQSILDLF